jgi:acetyl-CoA carboxylase carboxyltransferase component
VDEQLRNEISEASAAALDKARPEVVAATHQAGRLTARERITFLVDGGSFIEYGRLAGRTSAPDDSFPADGLICGSALIHGLPVLVAASDRSVLEGSQSDRNQRKLSRVFQIAESERSPVVLLMGARTEEPLSPPPIMVTPRGRYGLLDGLAQMNGRVPTVACVLNSVFDAQSAAALLCDYCVAVRSATIGVTDADGVRVEREVEAYAQRGDIDRVEETEEAVLNSVRYYLRFQQPTLENWFASSDYLDIAGFIPENRRRPYDMRKVVGAFADADSTLELQPNFGRSMLKVLARLQGRTIGIFANQPKSPLAGAIDSDAADKATRFMELCDAYGIPLVSFIDNPGFMVGPQSEIEGMARHHARPLAALHHRQVPLCSVQIRKAYGLGPYAMFGWGTSHNAPLLRLAWPTVESGGMSLEGAAYLVMRKEIQAAASPAEALEIRNAYADRMRDSTSGIRAGRIFQFDDIIDPEQTRERIGSMFSRVANRTERVHRAIDLR